MNEQDWKAKLSDEQYKILREKGTEPAFTGQYWDSHEAGMYACAGCGTDLFSSDTKFDSGSGWPSFWEAVNPEKVDFVEDTSHGMVRTEVVCSNCGGHLGHVFDDGPQKKPDGSDCSGKRFCINSAALDFKHADDIN